MWCIDFIQAYLRIDGYFLFLKLDIVVSIPHPSWRRALISHSSIMLTSPTRRLTVETWNSLSLVDVHIVRTGGSNNFSELWWIKEGWRIWNILCSLILLNTRVETWTFVHPHFHLGMGVLSGWGDPIASYGGSKRGGGCVIAGAYY
jgi:hypothetical protein